MSRYSISEARRNLPSVVDEAESGRSVGLTRRGRLVAVLLSAEQYNRLVGRAESFRASYDRFRSRFDLDEVGLEGEFASKLRDRSPGRPVDL